MYINRIWTVKIIWTEMSNVILLHSVSVQQKMESWGHVGGMYRQKQTDLLCFIFSEKGLQTALFTVSASGYIFSW